MFSKILESSNAITLILASIPLLVAVLTWSLNQWAQRKRDENLRKEKMVDIMEALIAEVQYYMEDREHLQPKLHDGINNFEQWYPKIIKDDPDYIPFFATQKSDKMFQIFSNEIHILPRKTITSLVAYFSQISTIENMRKDMQDSAFLKISAERRGYFFRDYLILCKGAYELGDTVIQELDNAIEINKKSPAALFPQATLVDFGIFEFLLVIAYFTILFIITLFFS